MSTETNRYLIACALIFGFMFFWTKYMTPQPQPAPVSAPTSTAPAIPSPVPAPAPSKAPAIAASKGKITPVETFEVKSDQMKGIFSNQSGSLTSVQLLAYAQTTKKDSDRVAIVPLAQPTTPPLLWNISFRASHTSEPSAVLNDQNTIYEWKSHEPNGISFQAAVGPDIRVTKSYRMSNQPYVIEQVVRVENLSKNMYYVDAMTSMTSTKNPPKKTNFLSFLQATPDVTGVAYAHEDAFHWNFADFAKGKVEVAQTPIDWSGFASQYFLLTAIPVQSMWTAIHGAPQGEASELKMDYAQRNLEPSSNIEYAINLYAGPKQMETLEAVHPTLDRAIQLGSWVGGLARLIHKLLNAIYKFIPNYGWAIIILTIIVRLAVFPLAQMQAKSMKRMTQHKPAMDALKTKYEKDRETYSRELMSYMKTHRINPASGCLPLLIQFPIFIALYRVLYNSIELRHAPFALWIHDLSAYDPFFVLPVLVGVTFFFQTKLNPTPVADPAQATMMKIMPIMFTAFMIFLPSGLNLYIFVSTLWGIVQQYLVQKQTT